MIGAWARVAPCLLAALAACNDDPPGGLKVGAFRRDVVGACDLPIPGGDDVKNIQTSLTLCPGDAQAPNNHVSLGDVIDLVIDYSGISFTPGTVVTNPTVTTLINGVNAPIAVSTTPVSNTANTDAVFQSSLVIPQSPFTTLAFQVQASPDFAAPHAIVLVIDDAAPRVVIDECANTGTDCHLVAGSQRVTARVSASGSQMQTSTLHVTVAGMGEILSQQVPLTRAVAGNRIEGTLSFAVPLATAGAQLSAFAEVGPSPSTTAQATLEAPGIAIDVAECPAQQPDPAQKRAPCSLFSGVTTIHATITLSTAKQPTTVALRQIVGQIPQTATVPVNVNRQVAGGGFSALVTIDAPAVVAKTTWDLQIEDGPFVQTFSDPNDTTTLIALTPPSVTIAVDPCSSAPCTLPAGAVQAVVRVTVDGQVIQHVTVRQRIDGVLQPTVATIDTTQSSGNSMIGVGFLNVPAARSGADWTLIADLGGQEGSTHATLSAPDVQLSLDACPQFPCTLVAGVGSTAAHVAVAGTLPQHVTVVSRVDSTVVSTTTLDINRSQGGSVVGDMMLDPPTIPGTWTVTVSDGDGSASRSIALVQPRITTALACGTSCQPTAGTSTVLIVTAPLRLRDQTTTVTATTATGTPILVNSSVPLTTIDNAAQTISGSISVPIPSTPGSQVIVDATVGGFRAATLVIQIAP